MINFNGELITSEEKIISIENRGFKYGDALFETIKYANGKLVFFEDHYFRLLASMRMLRMKIPMRFTLEFLEEEILKTIKKQENSNTYRIRFTVFRDSKGLYLPNQNNVGYLIEIAPNNYITKKKYSLDVFKDFYNYSGLLSTIKTNNRMINVLASIFASENDIDNCILLNEQKGVVEVTNANIFLIKGTVVKTPALTEGCIKGIVRKRIIEIIQKHPDFTIEETEISPFEIQKADEVFITNAIVGVQPVTKYKKKEFVTSVGEKLQNSLRLLELTT